MQINGLRSQKAKHTQEKSERKHNEINRLLAPSEEEVLNW